MIFKKRIYNSLGTGHELHIYKLMSKKLDRIKDQKERAKQKLRYYQHQEKCWSAGCQNSPEVTALMLKYDSIAKELFQMTDPSKMILDMATAFQSNPGGTGQDVWRGNDRVHRAGDGSLLHKK